LAWSCEKDLKAEAGKPAKAATSATASKAVEPAKAASPAPAAPTPAPKVEHTDTAGKGEMKEVCIDKVGKDGKVIMGKDGKPVQDCRKIRVRKKLEATEIPPAKK
jgi:hypothetical protein